VLLQAIIFVEVRALVVVVEVLQIEAAIVSL